MAAPVILVLDAAPSPRLGRLTGQARIVYTDERSLAERLPEADVLLVWDFTSDAVRAAWPDDGPRPRWVHTASAGVDRLLCPGLAASHGTVVTNARGVFELPVAEYVAGLVLAFAKDLPLTLELQRQRLWRHRETRQLAGSRAVVVGAGPIGREIMRLLHGLGVQVALVGRTARRTIHGPEDLDRLAAGADWVICAAPLTESTRAMFDARFFGLLQPYARFINVGRGPVVVEDDLAEALRRRWIAGAALDVFQEEPLSPDSPLWTTPGLLVSPHMSGDTAGWRDRLGEQFVSMYEQWASGLTLPNVVDIQRGYVPSPDIPL
ncbi:MULTISPECIES: D-2-hydroxyacid dehydrogenase [Streptomyces]|uniref:D-2-hydroxyacid dehydrogenase n=1 Tax=Streptomyces TaxID=1883 RepID=UPI0006FA7CE5|nr:MULTISPECIES: D-2-hydroxyacid dehydrogenase [Streptomyces]KQX78867.1 hydroxyacid dehydrogenase [Streptomyces sp. Root1319]KQZ03791.1 hydroxyacid dehydrogenase [Streptomyces sp. Root55]MDX3064403.1 D-2-hydroxyacid dehydrogenase [Streptomyces sp. ND04-05B]WUC28026.1 D-2-hydroxyacid dehydrogenase [Streptomyces clavifer]